MTSDVSICPHCGAYHKSGLPDEIRRIRAERDAYKIACEQAGICMTCVLQAPEPYRCTDCLNTRWANGSPYEQLKQVEAERDALRAKMEDNRRLWRSAEQLYDAMEKDNESLRAQIAVLRATAFQAQEMAKEQMAQVNVLRAQIETLREALSRLLLEFDFMIEKKIIVDVRDDMIFHNASTALAQTQPHT